MILPQCEDVKAEQPKAQANFPGAKNPIFHKEVLIMPGQREEISSQRLRKDEVDRPFYLSETGESFFMRTSGRGDFKVVNLISQSTFALVDVFFTSEEDARLFAEKRKLRIVDYTENVCSAPSN